LKVPLPSSRRTSAVILPVSPEATSKLRIATIWPSANAIAIESPTPDVPAVLMRTW
jgi:hypothetical protein